jgi:hypothetical protein
MSMQQVTIGSVRLAPRELADAREMKINVDSYQIMRFDQDIHGVDLHGEHLL